MEDSADMPIYEYECAQCHRIEEALQSFSDKPLKKCKVCSGRLHKLVSQSSFHLKGSGWYVTDYAKKTSNGADITKNKETPAPGQKDSQATKSKKSPVSKD